MKKIKTEEAVGKVLVQDITRIIVGKVKDTPYRRGHVVKSEDVDALLSLGKEHLFVFDEDDQDKMHEEDVAEALWKLCASPNIMRGSVQEGKIEAFAACDGLLRVNVKRLHEINSIGELTIVTKKNNSLVRKGDKIAGMRCIPLLLDTEQINEAKKISQDSPLLEVKPFIVRKAAVIITGTEIYSGRIEEAFTPLIKKRLMPYGAEIVYREIVPDELDKIESAIRKAHESGAEIIFCTGGMSVDPDDLTPIAIKNCATEFVLHGLPVLPGSMFCIAYLDDVALIGLPGGVIFSNPSAFDLFLPRFMANDRITRASCTVLGHGGLL